MNRKVLLSVTATLLCITALARAAVNTTTASFHELLTAYQAATDEAAAKHKGEVAALVDVFVGKTEEMLRGARETRSLADMAVARKAAELFDECKRQLNDTGTCEIPDKVSAAIRPMIQEFAELKKRLDIENTARLAEHDREFFARFRALAEKQGGDVSDMTELRVAFRDFLSGKSAVSVEQAPTQQDPATTAPAPLADEEPVAKDATVLAAKGEAGTWVTFATWRAEVAGMMVQEIPVANRNTPEVVEDTDPILQQPYKTHYMPLRVITPDATTPFQIRAIPGQQIVDVLDLPKEENEWTLVVRIRPGPRAPSRHAIELQTWEKAVTAVLPAAADVERAEQRPAVAADSPAGPQTAVRVGIKTVPDGALVYIDNQLYQTDDGIPRTPCIVRITPGKHTVRLALAGFVDGVITDFEAADRKVLNWKFERDAASRDEVVTVSPRAGWRSSRIQVEAGDRITISPEGIWSVGEKGEKTDFAGYPRDKAFVHYYNRPEGAPVQLPGVPYGALLLKIGRDGPAINVEKEDFVFAADRAGDIYFDTNETLIAEQRRDNTGELTVRIRIVSPTR